jgi:hypothetical protein
MGRGSRYLQAFALGQPTDEAALFREFFLGLGDVLAHRRSQLNHGLVQFRLEFALQQHQFAIGDKLGDVGAQLTGLRVDNLVFFFDADGQ